MPEEKLIPHGCYRQLYAKIVSVLAIQYPAERKKLNPVQIGINGKYTVLPGVTIQEEQI